MNYYAWLISLRLKILPLALCAILLGNALALRTHHFNVTILLLSLLTASLLQILSNLANDYGDVSKGTDMKGRIGPIRAVQRGLLTLNQLRMAIWINAGLCILSGLALLIIACNSLNQLIAFIGLGLFAIVAAITYTVGNKPYGYVGLGDLSVLIFFALVAVLGSDYLQTKNITWQHTLPAISSGLLAVAVLNINNLRDIDSDRQHNKRTLVVLIGKQMGRYYHLGLLTLSLLLFAFFACYFLASLWGWLFILMVPFFIWHIKAVFTFQSAHDAIPLLLQMVKLALVTNLLYCLAIILS